MKKRILIMVIAMVMVIGLVPSFALEASAADVASGTAGDISWKLTDDGTLTFSGTGAIPGYTLTARPDWYAFEAQIKKVVIESGITKVGNNAFNGCSALSEVILPDTLTEIRNNVFYDCTNLSYVEYWGTTAPTLGMGVFNGCDNLLVVNVPTNYEGDAFTRGLNVSKTLVPDEAEDEVCSHATFADGKCTACGIMGGYCGAETNEGGEQSVWWTYDETTGAFAVIGEGAMKRYSSYSNRPWNDIDEDVTSLTISEGVTHITFFAFADFKKITDVTIPASVEFLGTCAFLNCFSLETVTFAENSRLSVIEDAVIMASALTQITLPTSVTEIDPEAFCCCEELTDIFVEEGNTDYKDVDGVLYSANGATLLAYPQGKADNEFIIPEGVTTIERYAFQDSYNLETVIISDGVRKIMSCAFRASGLGTIIIPASVNRIDNDAFDGCELTTVNAPCNWDGSLYTFEDGVTVNIAEHSFDENGVCGGCGYECSHENYSNGECDVCGIVCTHEDNTNGSCDTCGVELFTHDGVVYEVLGDITYTGVEFVSYKMDGAYCYKAGDGYILAIKGDADTKIILYNATIDVSNTLSKYAICTYINSIEYIIYGTNNIYRNDGYAIFSSGASSEESGITMSCIDGGVLNIYGEYHGNYLTINSGRVNVYNVNETDGLNVGVDLGEKLTINEGATLTVVSGGSSLGFNIGVLTQRGIENNGTLNATYLEGVESDTELIYNLIFSGEVVLAGDVFNIFGGEEIPEDYRVEFNIVIPEGASVIIPEGFTLDLDSMTNVDVKGKIIAEGTLICTHTGGVPTCTEDGVCDICKTSYIEAFGHDYDDTVTDPDCERGGYTTHTCKVCGDIFKDNETEAVGHNFVEGECTVCGDAEPVVEEPNWFIRLINAIIAFFKRIFRL